MRIYRVEDKEHFGPYRTFDVSSEKAALAHELVAAHWNPMHHPTPFDEKLTFQPGFHMCGFDSLWKVNYWFDGFFERLLSVGFRLAVYDVDVTMALIGEFQAAIPIASKPIRTFDLRVAMCM